MNKSVELLLTRMKDFPQEFLSENATSITDYSARESRFGYIVGQIMGRKNPSTHVLSQSTPNKYLEFLTDEDVELLYQGLVAICEENFYAQIVNELAESNWEKRREIDKKLWEAQLRTSTLTHPAQNAVSVSSLGAGGVAGQGAYGGAGNQASQGLLSSLFGSRV